jgi:hypothetical protein
MTKTDLEFIHDEMDRFKKQTNPILTVSPGEFLDDQESAVVERFALDVIRAIRGFRGSSSRVVLPKVTAVDECCDESIPSGR